MKKSNNQKIAVLLICLLVLIGIGVAIYFACKSADYKPAALSGGKSGSGKSMLDRLMDDISSNKNSEQYTSQTNYKYGTQSKEDEAVVESVMANLTPKD